MHDAHTTAMTAPDATVAVTARAARPAAAGGAPMNFGAPLAPAFHTRRRRGVLAFTCIVHLLALWLWPQQRRPQPARPSRVVTFFLQTDGAHAARPPARTDPHRQRGPAPSRPAPAPSAPVRAAPPTHATPVPRPDDLTRVHADTQAAAVPTADAAAPAPDVFDTARPAGTAPEVRASTPVPAGPASTRGGFALGLAQHQAGRIDHELRKGKSGVPDEADTPWARFGRGLGAAHIDRSLTLQTDTYTSPDGVVIYRFRQGDRVRCRRAGGVGMPLRGMADGASAAMAGANSASAGDCPKGVTWNRDDP
jgi:hypothetical protein